MQSSCRHFNGYKPCGLNSDCNSSCPSLSVPSRRVLIVHLGAIGAVVRATSLLRPIKRKYPNAHITWVTDAPSDQLLRNHPGIDRVLTSKPEDLLALSALEFETAFVIDKSLKASGVLKVTQADRVFGFVADPRTGAILPSSPAAKELWEIGLNNTLKFYKNQKPETQLMVEALELGPFQQDEYELPLTSAEQSLKLQRKQTWLGSSKELILGINTGCSSVIPYKKLSVQFHRQVIQKAAALFPTVAIVLLGGPEDTERNAQIAEGLPVIQSPTTQGLRDGLVSVAAADVVLTGDSLGMHLAISQRKQVIAWFGPTCAQEIDLYGRGEKILSKAPCSPCWKRLCDKPTLCYDQVEINDILEALKRGFIQCQPMFSSKLPFSETCSSASLSFSA